MLAKPRKEMNKHSPQTMAGLRVQIPPQVYRNELRNLGISTPVKEKTLKPVSHRKCVD